MRFGKTLVDMMVVAGYIKASATLAMRGVVSAEAVALGALALIACLVLTRRKPLTFNSLRWRVILPAYGFYSWIQENGHGDAAATEHLWHQVLTLFIMLFGFYVMFSGVLGRETNRN